MTPQQTAAQEKEDERRIEKVQGAENLATEAVGHSGQPPDRIYVNAKAAAIPMNGVYTLAAHDGDLEYSLTPVLVTAESDAIILTMDNITAITISRALKAFSEGLFSGDQAGRVQRGRADYIRAYVDEAIRTLATKP